MAIWSVFAFSAGHAVEPINVLVALTPAAWNHANPLALALRYEEAMNTALENTGLNDRAVRFYPYPVPTLYTGSNPYQAITYLINGTDPALKNAREAVIPLAANGFDLVLMVIDGYDSTGICGAATRPTNFNASSNSEQKAFAVIDVNNQCSSILVDYVIPHEIGHILGAEHQAIGFGGDEPDEFPGIPVSYNHPVFTSAAYTVMARPSTVEMNKTHVQYSRANYGTLPGTAIAAGNSNDRDVYRLFNQTNWNKVAAYRPRKPSLFCGNYFLGCPIGCGHSPYMLTWNSSNANSYQVQHKQFANWKSYYTGSGTSTLASTGTVLAEQFRVRGVNEAGPGDWCYIWIQVQCSETQDPY